MNTARGRKLVVYYSISGPVWIHNLKIPFTSLIFILVTPSNLLPLMSHITCSCNVCIYEQIIRHASVAVTACVTVREIMVESPISDWMTSFLVHCMCRCVCNKCHSGGRIHVFFKWDEQWPLNSMWLRLKAQKRWKQKDLMIIRLLLFSTSGNKTHTQKSEWY